MRKLIVLAIGGRNIFMIGADVTQMRSHLVYHRKSFGSFCYLVIINDFILNCIKIKTLLTEHENFQIDQFNEST